MNTNQTLETMVLHRYARAVKKMLKLEEGPISRIYLRQLRIQRSKVSELTDEILNAQ